jgi:hypothetical protein
VGYECLAQIPLLVVPDQRLDGRTVSGVLGKPDARAVQGVVVAAVLELDHLNVIHGQGYVVRDYPPWVATPGSHAHVRREVLTGEGGAGGHEGRGGAFEDDAAAASGAGPDTLIHVIRRAKTPPAGATWTASMRHEQSRGLPIQQLRRGFRFTKIRIE